MSRRRIGIVGHAALGGSGVVAVQLAARLAAAGHDVHLFATDAPPRASHLSGVHLHRVVPAEYPVLDAPPYTIAMASALAEAIDRHQLEVVHVHYALPWAVAAQLALGIAETRPRLVVTLHGTDVTGIGADPSYQPALRAALRSADVVTTPSAALADTARAIGLVSSRPEVIANFVDAAAFSPPTSPPERPRIVHVSNYRSVKRTRWLVPALAAARAHGDVELLLVGDGPDRVAVEADARDAGLSHAVRSVGVVDDPAPWLRTATAFALPSEDESFGLSALEAMACGVPVVACRVGGLPEVVTDADGILVESDDAPGFARAVAALIADPERAAALGRAGRARALDRFTPEQATDAYLHSYDAPR